MWKSGRVSAGRKMRILSFSRSMHACMADTVRYRFFPYHPFDKDLRGSANEGQPTYFRVGPRILDSGDYLATSKDTHYTS